MKDCDYGLLHESQKHSYTVAFHLATNRATFFVDWHIGIGRKLWGLDVSDMDVIPGDTELAFGFWVVILLQLYDGYV